MAASTMDSARSRKVLMGTCGWSDPTLLRCGKFYPAFIRTGEDRLRHYSRHFPCVEVDTSTYAIPSPVAIGRWVNAVIPGFLFHFKAFGLFCSKAGAASTIPYRIRSKLAVSDHEQVKLYDLPSDIRDELWNIFNSALQPAYQAGRLGVVIFQFHLSFRPSEENHAHVLWCRKYLDSRYPMAVEFRCRDWFIGEQMRKTDNWLASNGLVLIASDELKHETFQRDREQTGLPPGQVRAVLPVAWPSTHQDFLYIRVHRREGNQRVLSDEELQNWETRLGSQLPPGLKGPIYFMWGTDWEDQPLINAKRLAEKLPKELVFDWKSTQKTTNRLQSMFTAASSKVQLPTNPDQPHEFDENSRSLTPDTELAKSSDSRNESMSVIIGKEVKCPIPDRYTDGPQSSPGKPLPLTKSSSSPKAADEKMVASKEMPESQPILEDGKILKQVALSHFPAHAEVADVSLYVKPGPRKETDFPAATKLLIKGRPVKKPRTVSTAMPTITSFFKRATPETS